MSIMCVCIYTYVYQKDVTYKNCKIEEKAVKKNKQCGMFLDYETHKKILIFWNS